LQDSLHAFRKAYLPALQSQQLSEIVPPLVFNAKILADNCYDKKPKTFHESVRLPKMKEELA
jgi:hypothetical protein